MTEQDAQNANRTIRHLVLKELTDRPGQVIYRDDIAEATGIEPLKVADTIRRLQADHPEIGDDFRTIVRARAWQYVPNAKAVRALKAMQKDDDKPRTKPLTRSLRDYFEGNPHRVIYLDELRSAMSTDDVPLEAAKITVGVNNAKITNEVLRTHLTTVVPGQAWQFNPPPVAASAPVEPARPAAPAPAPAPVEPAPVTTPAVVPGNDSNLLLFEKVGDLTDGSTLVRDDKQKLYKLTAL